MSGKAERLDFVDAYRGFAVVVMILWHTTDAWTIAADRTGASWDLLRLVGGLAAPSFLFLAGTGVGLKAAADARRSVRRGKTVAGLVTRGLEVAVIGYAMRCFMWLFDARGLFDPAAIPAASLLVAGFACVFVGLDRVLGRPRHGAVLLTIGGALLAGGIVALQFHDPERVLRMLRIDVLQAIGFSLAIVSAVTVGSGLATRPWAMLGLAALAALCTPLVASVTPASWPTPIAGLLAKLPAHAGAPGEPLFPIFPWISYVFAGAGVAVFWDRAARERRTWETLVAGAAIGALVACLTFEWVPVTYRLVSEHAWLVAPVRVAHRIGWALCLALVARAAWNHLPPMHVLGRSSMLVYVVHLELSFGSIAQPIKQKLGTVTMLAGWLALTAAMYGLAAFRQGPFDRWIKKRRDGA